jgi:hypothetical protein
MQVRPVATNVRMTGGTKGFVGGRCLLDYEDKRLAPATST